MFWLLMLLLAGYTLFLPVTLTVHVQHHGQPQTRLMLHLLGLRKTWIFRGLSGLSSFRSKRGGWLRTAWRSADRTRRYLRRHTEFARLDALILLHTGDAARTALYTGVLRSIAALFPHPHRRICVQPDFFRGRSTVQVRCIIRWKLGTLLLTAMMLLAENLLQQRLTESEAT